MRKLFLATFLCLTALCSWAQDEKPQFEGEIFRVRMSSGQGDEYRGKHELHGIYKNGNRHLIDTRLGRHIIQLLDQNRCIVYYDGQTEGVEYPLDKLFTLGHTNASYGISTEYEFAKTEETCNMLGYECEIYEGTKQLTQDYKAAKLQKDQVEAIRFAVCPRWQTDSIWQRSNPNYPIDGIVFKSVSDVKLKGSLSFSKIHSNLYTSEQIKEITERPVDDKELEVPSGITVHKFRTYFSAATLLNKLAADNKKALKKEKRWPTQLPDNDTFDTDDEWED